MSASSITVPRSRVTPQLYVENLVVGETIAWEETFCQFFTWLVCLLHLDFNPIHWNPIHARKTRFKRTIVHAITLWARISRHLAESYPGIAWVAFESEMLGPVHHGETVKFIAIVMCVEGNKALVEVHAYINERQVLRTASAISSKKKLRDSDR